MSHTRNITATAIFASAVFASYAEAVEQINIKFTNQSASVYFSVSTDCSSQYLSVQAFEDASKTSGSNINSSTVSLFGYSNNYCNPDIPILACVNWYGEIPATSFTVSGGKQLTGANLVAKINAFDYCTSSEILFYVNLNWMPTGPLVNESYSSRVQTPTALSRSSFKGTNREAVTTGIIQSIDSDGKPDGRFKFDGKSYNARIFDSKTGTLNVQRQ